MFHADDFFRDSLLANQVRGTDSTGLFQVDDDGLISWYKSGVNASSFLNQAAAQTAINRVTRCPINVGHVRSATVGSISHENAHPFKADREDGSCIIGVHNGTLTNWKNKPDAHKFKVDSDWIMHMLAKEGADAFEFFNGAFAIVWYDSAQPGHVFMARNKDRPLCYMVDEGGKTLIGCSELGMLGWLSSRNGFKVAKDGNLSTPFYLEEGKIYKFDLNKLGDYEETNYPKYDPDTSLTSNAGSWNYGTGATSLVPLTAQEAAYATARRQSLYDTEDEEYGGDSLPWGPYGAYPSQQSPRSSYLEERQEQVLDAVKKELSDVRYTKVEKKVDDPVVDSEALEHAMHKAIVSNNTTTQPLPKKLPSKVVLERAIANGEITLASVKASTATLGEQTEAKEEGVFGRVVEFKGLEYDEETSSCIGVFTITEEGYEPYECDGEIRFLTPKIAKDLYIDRRSGMAIITGYQKENHWYVLAMPTTEERLFISNRTFQLEEKQAIN